MGRAYTRSSVIQTDVDTVKPPLLNSSRKIMFVVHLRLENEVLPCTGTQYRFQLVTCINAILK